MHNAGQMTEGRRLRRPSAAVRCLRLGTLTEPVAAVPAPIAGISLVLGSLFVLLIAALTTSCSSATSATRSATPNVLDPTSSSTIPPNSRVPYRSTGPARPPAARTTAAVGAPPLSIDHAAVSTAVARAVPVVVAEAGAEGGPVIAANVLVTSNIGATYGLPELSALREQAVVKFAREPSPTDADYLTAPMFRRMVYPDAPVTPADLALVPLGDQWVVATALTCDSPVFPPDWSRLTRQLLAKDKSNGYLVTHIGLALVILRERACTVPDGDALRDEVVASLESLIPHPFVADDLSLEMAVVLQQLGRSDLVSPEWVAKTLDAQLPDGSWANDVGGQYGNWHTSALAIWFFEAVQDPQATGPFFS